MFEWSSRYPVNKIPDSKLRNKVASYVSSNIELNDHPPLLSRALSGFGAWIASWFLLSPLLSFALYQQGMASLFIGLSIIFGSVMLYRFGTGMFQQQMAIAVLLCGNGLLLFTAVEWWPGNDWATLSVAQLLITLCCYFLLDSELLRFVQPLTLVVFMLVWVSIEAYWGWGDLLLLIVVVCWVLLWGPQSRSEWARPLGFSMSYALIIISFWQVLLSSNPWESIAVLNHRVSLGLLLTAFFVVLCLIAKELNCSLPVVISFSLLSVSLAMFFNHGLLISGLLVLVGYWRDEPILLLLGRIFFGLFLFWYYYSLQSSLIEKGALLLMSGALCLAVAAYMQRSARIMLEPGRDVKIRNDS